MCSIYFFTLTGTGEGALIAHLDPSGKQKRLQLISLTLTNEIPTVVLLKKRGIKKYYFFTVV